MPYSGSIINSIILHITPLYQSLQLKEIGLDKKGYSYVIEEVNFTTKVNSLTLKSFKVYIMKTFLSLFYIKPCSSCTIKT